MTKTLSTQAQAAKAIRAELKAAYPTVTFKVTSSSFSMGNDVSIHWTDGPTTKEVDAIADKYQQGHFDGMIDLYEYSNSRDDIPQAKYVMTSRHTSDDALRSAVALVNRKRGWDIHIAERSYGDRTWLDMTNDHHTGNGWATSEVHREIQHTSMLCKDCHAATLPGDTFCPQCGDHLGTQEDDPLALDSPARS
jgi:hypothetical protein